MVEDNKTAQEVLIGLRTAQSLADLVETTRREMVKWGKEILEHFYLCFKDLGF